MKNINVPCYGIRIVDENEIKYVIFKFGELFGDLEWTADFDVDCMTIDLTKVKLTLPKINSIYKPTLVEFKVLEL